MERTDSAWYYEAVKKVELPYASVRSLQRYVAA